MYLTQHTGNVRTLHACICALQMLSSGWRGVYTFLISVVKDRKCISHSIRGMSPQYESPARMNLNICALQTLSSGWCIYLFLLHICCVLASLERVQTRVKDWVCMKTRVNKRHTRSIAHHVSPLSLTRNSTRPKRDSF